MRRILTVISTCLLTAVFISLSISAAPSSGGEKYAVLQRKAQRYFANKEWASASAMYQLMIDERPSEANSYSHAIVAEGMRSDSSAQLAYFRGALAHHIPFDTLLTRVRAVSFSCGATDLYEHFLLAVGNSQPWMRRVIDRYMLDYYSFRCNGPQIVAYSKTMLEGLPDDVRYLQYLARGYLLDGDFDHALATYRHIVDISPTDVTALLYLGNYYADVASDSQTALGYLRRAYEVRPTPYVQAKIRRLASDED